jgi:hypothetical protein
MDSFNLDLKLIKGPSESQDGFSPKCRDVSTNRLCRKIKPC